MRISDWSSDVCSSDLVGIENLCPILFRHIEKRRGRRDAGIVDKDLDRAELVLDPCDGRINAGPIGNTERYGKCFAALVGNRLCREIGRASCREGGCQYV